MTLPGQNETAVQVLERLLDHINDVAARSDDELPLWIATNAILMELSRLNGQSLNAVIASAKRRQGEASS